MSSWQAWALITGTSRVDQSMLTYLEGMGTEVTIPHISLLLRGPKTVLIDTGFGNPEEIADAYPQELFRSSEQDLERQLAQLGVAPHDISIIVHTHLHYDHVGNDHLFPAATVIAHAAELEYHADPTAPVMYREYFSPKYGFPAQFDSTRVTTVDSDTTLAPGLNVIHLPGHTPGSLGIIADTENGKLCFPGDLIMVRENLNGNRPVGLHTSVDDCEESRRRVLSLDANVIPSHDMRIFTDGDIQHIA